MRLPASTEATELGDDELRTAALALLRSSGYAAIRRLRCEFRGNVALITGIVPSYYLKLMAQSILLRLGGIRSVTNLVEVQSGSLLPVASDEDQPSGATIAGTAPPTQS
jgi:hypothetical protein